MIHHPRVQCTVLFQTFQRIHRRPTTPVYSLSNDMNGDVTSGNERHSMGVLYTSIDVHKIVISLTLIAIQTLALSPYGALI